MSFLKAIKGALVQGDDEGVATAVPSPVTQPVGAVNPVPLPSVVGASINLEVLEQTRDAVFSIGGSPFSRFMVESKKLESVIVDPNMRTKAVVTMLGISPADLVGALQTTHRAALDQWKSQIARARDEGHNSKVKTREQQIAALNDQDAGIQSQIVALQEQLKANNQKATALQQEIASAQAEIEGKARTYDAAIVATEAELNQTISTLQSIR